MRLFWATVSWQFGPLTRLWMGFLGLARHAACLADRGARPGSCSPGLVKRPGEQPGRLCLVSSLLSA